MARKDPATIYHIAEEAGVSISTVSRVLNASPNVSEESRKAVMEAIEKLGYIPKAEARARALQVSRRIGVLTPFFTAPSFVQRLRGVATGLGTYQYELIVYTVSSRQHLDSYLASLPITGNLEGLIVISLPVSEEQVNHLNNNHLDTVLIEYHQVGANTVEIDDQAGGRLAANYLYSKGHRKIAFLGDSNLTEYSITPVHNRLKGFSQQLRDLNLSLPPEYIAQSPDCSERGLEEALHATENLMRLPNPPTAVFAGTDLQAMGVMKAARLLGLKVPGDVAVLGFDNLDMAEFVGLTTINQQLDESGRIAVDMLLARRKSPERSIQHVQLPLTVIERETV